MSYTVDFVNVSTIGLESSPATKALAGLRANEARYFMNKYKKVFTVTPAAESQKIVDYVSKILKDERNMVIESKPLETASLEIVDEKRGKIRWVFVFYESGLGINIPYSVDDAKFRAVGFKLSEGMEVPKELSAFKFARQKSKLAGIIRGSYFIIKGEYR